MVARFTLNCPRCHRQLVLVPLDGLTLHYECAEHGALILQPLVPIDEEDDEPALESEHNGRERRGIQAR